MDLSPDFLKEPILQSKTESGIRPSTLDKQMPTTNCPQQQGVSPDVTRRLPGLPKKEKE